VTAAIVEQDVARLPSGVVRERQCAGAGGGGLEVVRGG